VCIYIYKIIIHSAPTYILRLMNLDIVIWNMALMMMIFLHDCLRNVKLHTPSIRVRKTVPKHIIC